MKLLLYIALLPGIILMFYIYKQDKVEKEPLSLLALLLFGGLLSAVVASFLEQIAENIIYIFIDENDILFQLVENFLGVALIEEGCKYFFLKKFSWNNYNFNCSFDGIIYAAFVSLGFALTENVLYAFSYGLETAVIRAVTAIPAHMAFGIVMGIFYSEAKFGLNNAIAKIYYRNKRVALLLPVLIHGLYDYCLSIGSDLLMIVWYVLMIIIYIIIFIIARKKAKNDREII